MKFALAQELEQMFGKVPPSHLKRVGKAPHITIYKGFIGADPVVIHRYGDEASKAEMHNLLLLNRLGIPTIPVLGATKNCLCFEDIEQSKRLRRGTEADLHDEGTARRLAGWYKLLHKKGLELKSDFSAPLPSDMITPQNLLKLWAAFPQECSTWNYILDHISAVQALMRQQEKTLCAGDFSWKHLAVARDNSIALMVDYAPLAPGLRASDVLHVSAKLNRRARAAFKETYGPVCKREISLDLCLRPLVQLIYLTENSGSPARIRPYLEAVHKGEVTYHMDSLI